MGDGSETRGLKQMGPNAKHSFFLILHDDTKMDIDGHTQTIL